MIDGPWTGVFDAEEVSFFLHVESVIANDQLAGLKRQDDPSKGPHGIIPAQIHGIQKLEAPVQ